MTNDSDRVGRSQSKLVEDSDLEEILQLAESIRANPIYDDPVDVSDHDLVSFFDTLQSSAPAVIQPVSAAEAVAMESKLSEMLTDDSTLLTLLKDCNEFQSAESLTEELGSYVSEEQPIVKKQPNILQLFEQGWLFTDYKSLSCSSTPGEHLQGPRSCCWPQYTASPSPSSSSSSPPPSVFDYPNCLYPGFMEQTTSCDHGRAGLYMMPTPALQSRPRRPSSVDGGSVSSSSSSSSSGSVSCRPRPVRRRARGKTNKMKVHHLWEFIRELLDASELQLQLSQRAGCAPTEVSPVTWENKEHGVFRIVDSKRMAKLWGEHKRNSTMTYEKLSRSLRWCRSSGFLSEVPKNANYPKKLCFRFGERAADMYTARRQHLLSCASLSS